MTPKTTYLYIAIPPLFWLINQIAFSYALNIFQINLITASFFAFIINPAKLDTSQRKHWGVIIIALLLISFIFMSQQMTFLFFGIILITAFVFTKEKRHYMSWLIIAMAAFNNLLFVSRNNLSLFQHDLLSCYNYIDYILENNFMFWQENPLLTRPSYSTYHPILHFFTAALWIKAGTLLGFARNIADEGFQVITVSYMLWYYILAHKILKTLPLEAFFHNTLLIFICFFPFYNELSGFFNNDTLVLPLSAGIIYHTLQYIKQNKKENLSYIWLYLTAASLTKLSSWVLLPFVAIALLFHFINQKNKTVFIEIFLFSLASLISLSLWPLYQYYVLHLGPTYVPTYASGIPLENYSFIQRFSPLKAFFYDRMFYRSFIINLWETLTKTALFDEQQFFRLSSISLFLMQSLTFCYKLIIGLNITAALHLAFKKNTFPQYILIISLFFGLFTGIILLTLHYPYTCNQNFRYIAILPLADALLLGLWSKYIRKEIKYGVTALLIIFAVLSLLVWQQIPTIK